MKILFELTIKKLDNLKQALSLLSSSKERVIILFFADSDIVIII